MAKYAAMRPYFEVVAQGLRTPSSLALDDTGIYASILGTPQRDFQDSSLVKIPKAGGPPVFVADAIGAVFGLAADATGVYWVSSGLRGGDGKVFHVDHPGAPPALLATGQHGPAGLAIDRDFVYWTTSDGQVHRVGKRGGSPTTLATDQDRPLDIAVSPAAVVWTNTGKADGENELPGALMALRR